MNSGALCTCFGVRASPQRLSWLCCLPSYHSLVHYHGSGTKAFSPLWTGMITAKATFIYHFLKCQVNQLKTVTFSISSSVLFSYCTRKICVSQNSCFSFLHCCFDWDQVAGSLPAASPTNAHLGPALPDQGAEGWQDFLAVPCPLHHCQPLGAWRRWPEALVPRCNSQALLLLLFIISPACAMCMR